MQSMSNASAYLVALTGGIGSGKSTVATLLVSHGAGLVDTDVIAHALTAPGGRAIEAIRQAFGDAVIAPDGSMDRAAMRAMVFGDASARTRLESILHPLIHQDSIAALTLLATRCPAPPYLVIDVPLLVERRSRWLRDSDRILVVDCPREVQIARVMARSGLTRTQVEAIIDSQAGREQRVACADDVIDNAGTRAELDEAVLALHQRYVQAAATQPTRASHRARSRVPDGNSH